MCGRYALVEGDIMHMIESQKWKPAGDILQYLRQNRRNVSPTQVVPGVTNINGERQIGLMKWGWERKWQGKKNLMINARSEKVTTSNVWKKAFHSQRCLVPASWYYEWATDGTKKFPLKIGHRGKEPLVFAGLWEVRKEEDEGPKAAVSIVTTDAMGLMAELHPRMPVILPPEDHQAWLEPASQESELQELLLPYPDDLLQALPADPLEPDDLIELPKP